MSRPRPSRFRSVIGLLLVAASLAVFSDRGIAASPPEGYTFRYALVIITPKGKDPAPHGELPEFLSKTNNGSEVVLGPTPEAFVKKLQQADDRYNIRLVSAGSAFTGEYARFAAVQSKPSDIADFRFQIADLVDVEEDDGKTLTVSRIGRQTMQTPGSTGRMVGGWNGVKPQFIPGLTYHGGIDGLSTGERLAYLLTILRGDARFPKSTD